eukprot:GFKZ01014466.1.p1 GENE.GFKZ01014466.1~~GFKZ01014466.1.p1  ORF type:complete len:328 (+),score=38.54 GFKZ01014466.1:180-1163(+)
MRPLLLKGHERPLTRVKFNREGDLLFTTAMDKAPTVWRASNGERIGTFKGHNGAVRDIDITWDTTRIVTGSMDQSAILWVAETGEKLYEWNFKSPVRCVAFSPGDGIIAIATAKLMGQDSNLYLFKHDKDSTDQPDEPLAILEGHTGTITKVLWYPTGEFIITASEDRTIRKWEVETGTEIASVTAHKHEIKDCQFDKDYTMLITASKDQTAKLWSYDDLTMLKSYSVDHPVNSAAISPLFPHILLGGGQEASQVTTTTDRQGKFEGKLFHLVYEDELGRVQGHFGPINTVAFSPDGKQYVSGGEDGFVRLHDFDEEYYVKGEEGRL